MYVVLGASGNTGHIVARNLLAQQKKVRVFGSTVLRSFTKLTVTPSAIPLDFVVARHELS